MRPESKEWLFLLGKTLLLVVGGVFVVAALIELYAAGASPRAFAVLALGLALALPPLALAYRDAVREARKGRI